MRLSRHRQHPQGNDSTFQPDASIGDDSPGDFLSLLLLLADFLSVLLLADCLSVILLVEFSYLILLVDDICI